MQTRTNHEDFETEYAQTSAVLLDYGCMVAPYILGGEWQALSDRCRGIRSDPPTTAEERCRVEGELSDLLTNCVYNPNYRAFYVYRSIELPHLKEVSHLIERAVLHYFKRDYLSCALCLLPAVEGALRSYCGWSLGMPEPKFRELAEAPRRGKPTTYPIRHTQYTNAMASFLERWLYKPTRGANFELSYLNRHYALHGLGPESFYRATDCTRLFLFFDLFADVLTLEGHGEKHVMIPCHIEELNLRREHYERVLLEAEVPNRSRDVEEAFLRQHVRFIPESRPIRLEEVVLRWSRVMGLNP